MYFNSVEFLIFLAIVYPLYLLLGHRWQNRMLLVASYVFYGWWDWRFLFLLVISTMIDYVCGLKIDSSEDQRVRKRFLTYSMVSNLVLLGTFKYFGFFADSFAALMNTLGLQVSPVTLNIVLPVGISFYTFQTMSYTIDIYRRQMKATRNMVDFALFVSFFPQLVAGPIERARKLLPQIAGPRTLDIHQIQEGLFLMGWGLFKKIIIADNVATIVNYTIANCQGAAFWDIYIAFSAFSVQLYCDFSGYSDIARGLAKLMGMELMVNFRLPYFAVRPSDFWGRWHISLTTWVRDYLFVSLGANRRGELRGHLNLLLTMTVIGLWHGASWNFVLWGVYFGLIQIVHALIQPVLARLVRPRSDVQRALVKYASMFCMYHVWLSSGFLFRAQSLAHTARLLRACSAGFIPTAETIRTALIVLAFSLPLMAMQVLQYRTKDLLAFMKLKPFVRFALVLAAVYIIFLVHLLGADIRTGEEFIYFQF